MNRIGVALLGVALFGLALSLSSQNVNAQAGVGLLQGTVVDENGDPAALSHIAIYQSGYYYSPYREIISDNQGQYSVYLPAGDWKIEFERNGGAAYYYQNEWYNDKTDGSTADTVSITSPGNTVANATLTRNGQIKGRLWSAVGAPANACVDLYEQRTLYNGATASDYYIATEQGDTDGRFIFTQLKLGKYALFVGDCDGSTHNIKDQWYSYQNTYSTATTIELAYGQMHRDIGIYTAELESTIEGRLVNSDSEPIANMCVELGLSNSIPATYNPYRVVRTDSDGRYMFDELEKQTTYHWLAYSCSPETDNYFQGTLHSAWFFRQGDDRTEPDETLLRKSTISGRVTDSQGQPIWGIHVEAAAGFGWNSRSGSAQTDANGEYIMTVYDYNLPYTITFGCGNLYCTYDEYQRPDPVPVPKDNTHITGINAQLFKKTSIGGSISGVAIEPYNYYGFGVELYKDGVILKTVEANGSFDFSALQPGVYTLHFVDNGYCVFYDWWYPYGCALVGREANTYQDHWYKEQRTQDKATEIVLSEGDKVSLNIILLPWGEYFTTPVDIDVKPGNEDNKVNCTNEKGVVPVALFSTADFDATSVDQSTITLSSSSPNLLHKKAHLEDVNGDGLIDLLMHFKLSETDLNCGDDTALFTAETTDGQSLEGSDSIYLFEPGNKTNKFTKILN